MTLLESLCMMIWLHIVFNKQLIESKRKLLFIIVYVFFYFFVYIVKWGIVADIVFALCILLWLMKEFGEKFIRTIFNFVICVLVVNLSQIVSLHIMLYVNRLTSIRDEYVYIYTAVICLMISACAYCCKRCEKYELIKLPQYTIPVCIYIACIMIFVKWDYEKNKSGYSSLYLFLYLLLVIFVCLMFRTVKLNHKLEQKQLELDLREKYEEVYSKLLSEMRLKQHDYKNQISALYSIGLVNNGEETVAKNQKEYGDKLLQSTEFDHLLLNSDNAVLSGYVYTICNEARRHGIEIEPRVACAKRDLAIPLHEIIEVLGILLNNSIEYLDSVMGINKTIKLSIYEDSNRIHIHVDNTSEYKTYEEMERMFEEGYSTKGEDRGIGLYSLKNIVTRYKGELIVHHYKSEDTNWTSIGVVI